VTLLPGASGIGDPQRFDGVAYTTQASLCRVQLFLSARFSQEEEWDPTLTAIMGSAVTVYLVTLLVLLQ